MYVYNLAKIISIKSRLKKDKKQKKRHLQGSNLRGLPHGISSPTP